MEWRPIETAPKDGTHFLAYGPGIGAAERGYSIAAWGGEKSIPLFGFPGFVAFVAGWQVYGDCQFETEGQPTHWQPLPSPPVEEA